MADAKIQALSRKLIFALLVIFPFGQLFRIDLVPEWGLRVQLIDILVISSLPLLFLLKRKDKALLAGSFTVLFVFLFSLVFSTAYWGFLPLAWLYFIRFSGYVAFLNLIYAVFARKKDLKKTVISSLVGVSVFAGILGWYQYFVYPDFRPFKIIGWDDHLFRLVGSFLDPGFLGIILVLGFILALGAYLTKKGKVALGVSLFLLLTIAFTYSRASYLAVIVGTLVLFKLEKYKKAFLVSLLFVFALVVLLLPRPGSEGVKLERIASIAARAVNYKETLAIWRLSPIFGVGFNNMCFFRQAIGLDEKYASHSCSGADSSLLFLLATTGTTGLIVFLSFSGKVVLKSRNSEYGNLVVASAASLLTHSAFVNSMFYPWVLVWFGLLLGATAASRKA